MRAPFDVMVIVDPRAAGVLEALARLAAATSGERIAVQLRAKDASDAALIDLAREVSAVLPAMSRLLVNGRLSVARAVAADGVHLPEAGEPVALARAALEAGALVGCSCHDAAGAARRFEQGADYVLLGPLGHVPGKPALPAEAFAAAARAAGGPVLALGGIADEAGADRALALGASGVALTRALLDPAAPAWIARWLARRLAA